jgi:CDP-paratose 2-epimerase
VKAFELAYKRKDKVAGMVFNIGGGPKNTLSLHKLIELLERLQNRKIQAKYQNWRPGDQKIFVGNISLAKKILGWNPTISPKNGVKELYNWVAENIKLFK